MNLWKGITNFGMWGFLVVSVHYKTFTWWQFAIVSLITLIVSALEEKKR